jgi:2-phospho-L-lactate/phosphoenolpyruvate guanylyltransferase
MTSVFALVPIKDPAHGKSRLARVLERGQRRVLNAFLAKRTLEACTRVFGAVRTLVVTSSAEAAGIARACGVPAIPDESHEQDVNAALAAAARSASLAGAQAILVVPTDLALLTESSLRAAVAEMPGPPGCLLVPDRRGSGTNLMGLAPARSDLFAFGEPSLERHAANATRFGYEVRIHRCEALALDLDRPEDYNQLRRTAAWPIFEKVLNSAGGVEERDGVHDPASAA